MQSLKTWSLKEKLALIPLFLALFLSAVYVLEERSPEQTQVQSRPELSIALKTSPAAIPSTEAPFDPRS
jgi:hypothetical protein